MDDNHHLSSDGLPHAGDGDWSMDAEYLPASLEVQPWDDLKSDLTSEGDSWIVVSDDDRESPEKRNTPNRQKFREQYDIAADYLPFAPAALSGACANGDHRDPCPPNGTEQGALDAVRSMDVQCHGRNRTPGQVPSSAWIESKEIKGHVAISTPQPCTEAIGSSAEVWEAVVATDATASAAAAVLEKAPSSIATPRPDETSACMYSPLPNENTKGDKEVARLLWDATPPFDAHAGGSSGAACDDDEPTFFLDRIRRRMADMYDRHRHNVLPVVAAHVASFLIGLYIGRKSIAIAAATTARPASPKMV